MDSKGMRIIVIGASAGGLEALCNLVSQLPKSLRAALFIVQHMAADATGGVLIEALKKSGPLNCKQAANGEKIKIGQIYVASPDHHLLVGKGHVILSKGARENRSRPGIDPLFRSAALAYNSKVIAVVLTGYLDDGSAGLVAVKRCGGICIVQDSKDAAYPFMPQNALNNVDVDYCLPVRSMGDVLVRLVQSSTPKRARIPKDIAIEATIAERVLSDLKSVNALGDQVPFNCPNCGGVLWKIKDAVPLRYRCHTGHSFTASVLLIEQTKKIEETLWIALRMFEERKNLLRTMAGTSERGVAERLKDQDVHIKRIRSMLWTTNAVTSESAPGRKRRRNDTGREKAELFGT